MGTSGPEDYEEHLIFPMTDLPHVDNRLESILHSVRVDRRTAPLQLHYRYRPPQPPTATKKENGQTALLLLRRIAAIHVVNRIVRVSYQVASLEVGQEVPGRRTMSFITFLNHTWRHVGDNDNLYLRTVLRDGNNEYRIINSYDQSLFYD